MALILIVHFLQKLVQMTTHFQAFSPSYENISNRISRLRHSSQNHHHSSYAPSSTPPKPITLFTLDPKPSPSLRPTPVPTHLHQDPITTGKFTGRINKNVGLKKYNQRQLKEVMTANKEPSYLRTQGNYGSQKPKERFVTEGSTSGQIQDWSWKQGVDAVQMDPKVESRWEDVGESDFKAKLIPGKMYRREYLMALLNK